MSDWTPELLALAIIEAELRVNQDGGRPLVEAVNTDDPNWHDREALLDAAATDDPKQTIHLLAHLCASIMRRDYGDDALASLDRLRELLG